MEKVGIGIIGTGSIARAHAKGYLANSDRAEIVAACDINREAVESFAAQHGVDRIFTDHTEMLREPSIDAVSVCTPNYLHAPIAIEALKCGKHVLCEKPMATKLSDAEEMVRVAREADRKLYIGFNHRFIASFWKAREILRKEALGRAVAIRILYGHTLLERLMPSWFGELAKSGGGPLIDNGIHMLDMLRWMFGEVEEVKAVSTKFTEVGTVEDNVMVLLQLEGGAIASLQCSWSWWGVSPMELEVICEEGLVKVDHRNLWYYDRSIPGKVIPELDKIDAWKEETGHFLTSIIEDTEPFVTPLDGVRSLEIALAAYESAKLGKAIRLAHGTGEG